MAATKDINDSDYTSIPEFYNGKSVFITGATGFLGKVRYLCINFYKMQKYIF